MDTADASASLISSCSGLDRTSSSSSTEVQPPSKCHISRLSYLCSSAAAILSSLLPSCLDGLNSSTESLNPLFMMKSLIPLTITFRSEEHKSELQSLMRISYDVFYLKKKKSHIFIPSYFCCLYTNKNTQLKNYRKQQNKV